MKEPGKMQLKLFLAGLAVAWILSEPQSEMAQRSGGVRPYNPAGTDARAGATVAGGTVFDKRETPVDLETRMLRRRAAAELAEDLSRLRRINRERILPLSESQSLDYRVLSQVTGEIKGRAKRIKSNSPLALRVKGEKRTYEADPAHLGSMLPELSRLIDSFLANPVFRTASVHDDELRSIAGRDLESIIRLSDTISKVAKRLAKTATESAKG